MKLEITGDRRSLPRTVKDVARRRLHYALGRFGHTIDRVTVRFSDENGPRGGGYQCKVLVVPSGQLRTLVIEESGRDLVSAIAQAAHRAGRAWGRMVSRLRTRPRRST